MNKDFSDILEKLGIKELNAMQIAAMESISRHSEVVLLSPTGSGKTLAFLLPLIASLDRNDDRIQALILVPSRELANQIEDVSRNIGSGFKINAVYGGRSGSKDKIELKHSPAILIGTPGRVADHIRRKNIEVNGIKTLILDEFDKSLETGFEKEMQEIVLSLQTVSKKILTSATEKVQLPAFMNLSNPEKLNFLGKSQSQLKQKTILSPGRDKLPTLAHLIAHTGNENGIIFCNLKDTLQQVSNFLKKRKIEHATFYGGMEQLDREHALLKFRNGTVKILLATDLAARGIDVPEMDFIIHYQLPFKHEEFIHRNGRTARMNKNGTAYSIVVKGEKIPSYIKEVKILNIEESRVPIEVSQSSWTTLFISGGRKDKISKGDIAGLFFKQGNLENDELGTIELKQNCAFVAVPSIKAEELIRKLNNSKIKKRKVRISLLD